MWIVSFGFTPTKAVSIRKIGQEYATHETVNHAKKEYARGDVTTNTVEGYFSVFKRGMRGVYQHCAEKHLHRYLAEYDFRYNHREALGYDDQDRTLAAVCGGEGKRLTYQAACTVPILWCQLRNSDFTPALPPATYAYG